MLIDTDKKSSDFNNNSNHLNLKRGFGSLVQCLPSMYKAPQKQKTCNRKKFKGKYVLRISISLIKFLEVLFSSTVLKITDLSTLIFYNYFCDIYYYSKEK
jgi:hypothetical protein